MSQALYRKWRPLKWDQVVGQQHIVQPLTNAILADRVRHAYLFAGPRGTGKTTIARLLAKAVNCLNDKRDKRPCNECAHCVAVNENRFLDLIEIDAASNTSVDNVRDLREKINYSPSQGKYKIYIIDEVHMLSTAAFNALLKTLEEPPPHAIFVLATTEIHKIPVTVLSRCQRHEFRRVPMDDIVGYLKQIAKVEKIKAEDEALKFIARQSAGGMRDAISLLDQLASTGQKIDLALTQTVLGTAASQTVLDLIASIKDQLPATAMYSIQRALDAGADPRSLARQIVDYLRGLILFQMDNEDQIEVTKDIKTAMAEHAKAFSTKDVLRMMKAFNAAATDARGSWQPSLGLELAVAEMLVTPMETGSKKQEEKALETQQAQPPEENAKPEKKPAKKSKSKPKNDAPVIELKEVLKVWREVRAAIKPDHPGIEALLNSCKPLDVLGDELTLGFQSETVRSLMDMPEKVQVANEALKEILGVDLHIQCVVTNAKGDLPADIDPNGMVATAIQNGGEIVDTQE